MVFIKERLCSGLIEIQGEGTWPLESLIGVAARRNSTRGYLLVSKVLGKHIPTAVGMMHKSYIDLAIQLPAYITGPVVFIGMGETATSLGFGVFEEWRTRTQRDDAMYIHTSRYHPYGCDIISFEETHSHGPSQLLCIPSEKTTRMIWENVKTVVVVDDEVTTGKTANSLVAAIEKSNHEIDFKFLLSLVSPKQTNELTQLLSDWSLISLVKIDLRFHADGIEVLQSDPQSVTCVKDGKGSHSWGRKAVLSTQQPTQEILDRVRNAVLDKSNIYLVGSGELMYPAYLIGKYLEASGRNPFVQATTRSPVMIGNAIKNSIELEDGLGSGVKFYLHNPPEVGSCVIALHEQGCSKSTELLVERLGAIAIEV